MKTLFNIQALKSSIDGGITVITSNKRLASKITQAYCLNKVEKIGSIKNPAIFSVDDYFTGLWASAQEYGYSWAKCIINSTQRKQLFQRCIKDVAGTNEFMMGVTNLSGYADSAYESLQSRMLTINSIPQDSPASKALICWVERFIQYLDKYSMVTKEDAYQLLAGNYHWEEMNRAILVGFEQISPLTDHLIRTAFKGGVLIHENTSYCECIKRTECSTADEEIKAAAIWAKSKIETDVNATVGIIIPELGTKRSVVEKIFTRVFEPQFYSPIIERYSLPFNFSAGIPLASCPVIHDAIECLKLVEGSSEIEQISKLLMSPFWGLSGDGEGHRYHIENRLRKLQRHRVKLGDILRSATKAVAALGESNDIGNLVNYISILRPKSVLPASEWARIFLQELNSIGWPGSRKPDSIEFQQISQFYNSLENLSSLSLVGTKFNREQAITTFTQILSGTPFQAKTADSPIQLLGALEGAELKYDFLWVVGLSQDAWPPSAQPNPLLPLYFQIQHDMPRCNPTRELDLATALTKSFSRSGREVVFSHACHDIDGNQLLPSALIINLPCTQKFVGVSDAIDTHAGNIFNNKSLSTIVDVSGPPINSDTAKGGTNILKDQAACPFNAFAKYRLGAVPIPTPIAGLSPATKGNIIHDVLANLWRKWKSQTELKLLSEEKMSSEINKQIHNVFIQYAEKNPDTMTERFRKIETKRIFNIIWELLKIELERPNFIVEHIEKDEECKIGKLTINVRLDRQDKIVENGASIVIDYKTGLGTHPKSWLGQRPEDPQLPLYSIVANPQTKGIIFGVCNTRNVALIGLGDSLISFGAVENISDPKTKWALGLPETWDEMTSNWKIILETIANEYSDGHALVAFSSTTVERYAKEYLPLNRANEVLNEEDRND